MCTGEGERQGERERGVLIHPFPVGKNVVVVLFLLLEKKNVHLFPSSFPKRRRRAKNHVFAGAENYLKIAGNKENNQNWSVQDSTTKVIPCQFYLPLI